mmetsp:Transcript_26857/g.30697  ORF Transcript_26857/g.30697 Transcript_26857/m.30697 type:complete len:346 (+) Transcript_26857:222-1259(+)|eukprot:CAMPEP_0194140810 /NCGR_PEP_ID=MMETSP0152-20130528/10321_1 /TAXON_ID=1049557 /ORGANISM="Thalassiothrix antarctica, Strain L6-D1" /LENGTH=345 /DNA_ID=CAMNT_0038839213 /DNA_START=182 /DNA_END=1219 /DNA_ORIENTATION=-
MRDNDALNMNFNTCRNLKVDTVMDELRVILQLESTIYSNKFDYLSFVTEDDQRISSERVSESWRRKICEWSFEVVDHFGFDREVVSIALDFLDRVVANETVPSGITMNRREFQLIAVTCLYLAIKLHGETDTIEGPRRKLKIQAFVELSRGLFSTKILEEKELEILKMLDWKVNPPSTVRIVSTLLRLLPERSPYDNASVHSNAITTIYEMARYLTELSVCVSTFTFNYKPSEVAYACILCSIDALRGKVHIPYSARIQFMNQVTVSTNLTPHAVATVRTLLMDLCPAIFSKDELSSTTLIRAASITDSPNTNEFPGGNGKTSPVCVMAEYQNESSPRKRSRLTD